MIIALLAKPWTFLVIEINGKSVNVDYTLFVPSRR